MNRDIFIKGMALLKEAFNRDFNFAIYWESLQDLDDGAFKKATVEIIKNTKELYPNTNLIAIIREKANAIRKQDAERLPALSDDRSDPPPPEFHEMMKKIKGVA
jgi:hypothetical protein